MSYSPKIHLKRKDSDLNPIVVNLKSDTSGSPIYPKVGEFVEHDGITYEVELVVWNLNQTVLDVCASEFE